MLLLYVLIIYNTSMKYYGYARVSTKEQSDNSIDHQLKYLELRAKSLKLPFEGYSEKESGKTFYDRTELQKIISIACDGDYLGVYDNSRLGRNTRESLEIVDKLLDKGIIVQISGQSFNKNSPRERLILTIESAISEFYRMDQNLKSRAGIDIIKEKGEWIFTSKLYGYNLTPSKKSPVISINEKEAKIIRFIFNEYSKGKSTNQKQMN